MQAVKGYLADGHFIPLDGAALPSYAQVIVVIEEILQKTEDTNPLNYVPDIPIEMTEAEHHARNEWLNRLRDARELAKDEHLPDWPFQRSKEMRPPINLAD